MFLRVLFCSVVFAPVLKVKKSHFVAAPASVTTILSKSTEQGASYPVVEENKSSAGTKNEDVKEIEKIG